MIKKYFFRSKLYSMFLKSRQNILCATSMKSLCIARDNEACTDSNSKNVNQHISWYMYFYHVLVHVTIKILHKCFYNIPVCNCGPKFIQCFYPVAVLPPKSLDLCFSICLYLRFLGEPDYNSVQCSRYLNIWLLVFHLSNEYPSEGCLLSTDEFHFWWNPTIKYIYNLTWLTSMK